MNITHQDIVDRMEALAISKSEIAERERERIRKEEESVRELCGGLGHVYAVSRYFPPRRSCCFCNAAEPLAGGATP